MQFKFILLIFVLFMRNHNVDASRILGLFPMNSFSHYILGHTLLEEMANRGHEIVIITPYSQNREIKNYREVYLTGLIEKVDECKKEFFEFATSNAVRQLITFYEMGLVLTEFVLEHQSVKDLVASNEHFDLILMDQFMNEALLGLVHRFKAPLIFSSSLGASLWSNHLVANPAPMAFVPNLCLGYTSHMSFPQRVTNVYVNLVEEVYRHYVNFPAHDALLQKHFPGAPPMKSLLYNASLVLSNSHVSTNNPVPHVPNMIEIGGFHVKRGNLTKELQSFMDSAKDGVIYMALGSNVKSADLSPEKRDVFLKVLGSLKQKVLWKFETDLPGKPKNVLIQKWFPQQSVLGHPNTKGFISHGGLVGSIEAVFFGVPVLGVPLFADQKMNIKLAAKGGYAVSVPFGELTEDLLRWGLNEIVNNPKYRENIQKRSRIMNDRVVKPLDEAVYWVEYVIRHKGALHLKSAGMDLAWYQYELLDVILFYITVIAITLLLICIAFRSMWNVLCSKSVCSKVNNNSSDNKKKL